MTRRFASPTTCPRGSREVSDVVIVGGSRGGREVSDVVIAGGCRGGREVSDVVIAGGCRGGRCRSVEGVVEG